MRPPQESRPVGVPASGTQPALLLGSGARPAAPPLLLGLGSGPGAGAGGPSAAAAATAGVGQALPLSALPPLNPPLALAQLQPHQLQLQLPVAVHMHMHVLAAAQQQLLQHQAAAAAMAAQLAAPPAARLAAPPVAQAPASRPAGEHEYDGMSAEACALLLAAAADAAAAQSYAAGGGRLQFRLQAPDGGPAVVHTVHDRLPGEPQQLTDHWPVTGGTGGRVHHQLAFHNQLGTRCALLRKQRRLTGCRLDGTAGQAVDVQLAYNPPSPGSCGQSQQTGHGLWLHPERKGTCTVTVKAAQQQLSSTKLRVHWTFVLREPAQHEDVAAAAPFWRLTDDGKLLGCVALMGFPGDVLETAPLDTARPLLCLPAAPGAAAAAAAAAATPAAATPAAATLAAATLAAAPVEAALAASGPVPGAASLPPPAGAAGAAGAVSTVLVPSACPAEGASFAGVFDDDDDVLLDAAADLLWQQQQQQPAGESAPAAAAVAEAADRRRELEAELHLLDLTTHCAALQRQLTEQLQAASASASSSPPLPLHTLAATAAHLQHELLWLAAGMAGSSSQAAAAQLLERVAAHNAAARHPQQGQPAAVVSAAGAREPWFLRRSALHLLVSTVRVWGPLERPEQPPAQALDSTGRLHLLNELCRGPGLRELLDARNGNAATPFFTAAHFCVPEALDWLLQRPELTFKRMLAASKRGKLCWHITSTQAAQPGSNRDELRRGLVQILTALGRRTRAWLDARSQEQEQRLRDLVVRRRQQQEQRRQQRLREEAAEHGRAPPVHEAAAAAAWAPPSPPASPPQPPAAARGSLGLDDDTLWWLHQYVLFHTKWASRKVPASPLYDGALLEEVALELLGFSPRVAA